MSEQVVSRMGWGGRIVSEANAFAQILQQSE